MWQFGKKSVTIWKKSVTIWKKSVTIWKKKVWQFGKKSVTIWSVRIWGHVIEKIEFSQMLKFKMIWSSPSKNGVKFCTEILEMTSRCVNRFSIFLSHLHKPYLFIFLPFPEFGTYSSEISRFREFRFLTNPANPEMVSILIAKSDSVSFS